MSHIIECSQLTVRYKSTTAIDNIQLSIPAGVTVGIIGPDGVGKSTLLSLIAGERMMQQGSLQVLGGNSGRPGGLDQRLHTADKTRCSRGTLHD